MAMGKVSCGFAPMPKNHWGMVGIQPIYIHKNHDFGDGYG